MVPVPGGCWWRKPDYSCCPDACALAETDPAKLALLEQAAVEFLAAASYNQYPGTGCKRLIRPPLECCRCPQCCCGPDWGGKEPLHIAPVGVHVDPESVKLWVCGTESDNTVSLVQTPNGTYAVPSQMWPQGQDYSADPRTVHDCDGCCGCVWGLEFCWSTPEPHLATLALEALVCHMLAACDEMHESDCGCNTNGKPAPGADSMQIGTVTITYNKLAKSLASSGSYIRTNIDAVDQFLILAPPPEPDYGNIGLVSHAPADPYADTFDGGMSQQWL